MIEHILIEESVRFHPLAQAAVEAQVVAQSQLPRLHYIADKDTTAAQRLLSDPSTADAYTQGKSILMLRASRGEPFKTCPGTDGVVCCNYTVFNFISGCPMGCSYCYLQSYLNQPALSLQVNLEEPLEAMTQRFSAEPKRLFRVGTGELADSLALPASDPLNRYLVRKLSAHANVMLELKTKSARIEHLLDVDCRGRVIISWSMSPPRLSQLEEHGTASPVVRLQAAQRALQAGYKVGFHLDPLMFCHENWPDWEREYDELLTMIFDAIPAGQIAWLSVGSLRLIKGLRERMLETFPESALAAQEMVPGSDGKLRYPKPMRKRMFQFISERVERLAGAQAPALYLCMEAREVWNKSLGGTPDPQGKLRPLFSAAVPRPISLASKAS